MHLGIFIALNAYVTKEERFKVNDLSYHFGKLEKKQIKCKVSRQKELNSEQKSTKMETGDHLPRLGHAMK